MNALLVPRRSDGGQRDRIWNFLRGHWSQLGWPIYEGHHMDGPFNCAKALNGAARQGDWDFAVILGSDLYVSLNQLRVAVAKSSRTGYLVHAHDHFYCLSEEGTEAVLNGAEPSPEMAEWDEPKIGNGPVVVPRDLWESVGGYDEGFVGWGYEDCAFRLRCKQAKGEGWIPGPNYHLWHPEASRERTEDNRLRWVEYLDGKR